MTRKKGKAIIQEIIVPGDRDRDGVGGGRGRERERETKSRRGIKFGGCKIERQGKV